MCNLCNQDTHCLLRSSLHKFTTYVSSLLIFWLNLLNGMSWYVVKEFFFLLYSSMTDDSEVNTLYLSLSSINTIWTEIPAAIILVLFILIDSPFLSNSCKYEKSIQVSNYVYSKC